MDQALRLTGSDFDRFFGNGPFVIMHDGAVHTLGTARAAVAEIAAFEDAHGLSAGKPGRNAADDSHPRMPTKLTTRKPTKPALPAALAKRATAAAKAKITHLLREAVNDRHVP